MNFFQWITNALKGISTSTPSVQMKPPSNQSGTSSQTNTSVKRVPDLPWIKEMRKVTGLHETRDNAELKAWLKSDGATVGDPAKIPWCGDGVQTSFALSLPEEKLPSNPWASINWAKWGLAVQPQYGCVLVFWRGKSQANWEGHVGFYLGEDEKYFFVLGTNQSDEVSITKIEKRKLRTGGARWPIHGPRPTGLTIQLSGFEEAKSLV